MIRTIQIAPYISAQGVLVAKSGNTATVRVGNDLHTGKLIKGYRT